MALSESRKGESLVGLSGLIWAFFPVITVLSYAWIPSLHSLAWSTLFATLTFAIVVSYRKRWGELRNPQLWKYGLLIAFFIGILFYGLYYVGLETTTPGNAAIIALFEVFTASVFFHVFRGEKIPFPHMAGALLMIVGAVIVLAQGFTDFHIGDLLILVATFFTPMGNYFQQRARAIASSDTIMFMRSLLSVPFLFLLAYTLHPNIGLTQVQSSLPILLFSGIILLGLSKIFWIEGIHRISVPKALALQSVVPFLTLLIAWVILAQQPTIWQLTSLVPFVLGVLLLTDHLKLFRNNPKRV